MDITYTGVPIPPALAELDAPALRAFVELLDRLREQNPAIPLSEVRFAVEYLAKLKDAGLREPIKEVPVCYG